ncbi:MAG: GH92 family glycosyl hydrolase [Bacteroidaceae bacterium]|nr:GH92 family glycosyl hydrolase [Bacteroidaceae bacterium]MBO7168032.1 GH92 family glycosyl hydrolase [Bacteroidaceae bacterium]MBQ2293346.1 GH92 family glycosyl hydrolase [Bacteroidaceae bacterium]
MKKGFLSLMLLASCAFLRAEAQTSQSLIQYVEPRIGTAHCRSFHFAPGSMPFGMAKPGPSTNGSLGNADGWQATGYDYRDTSIEGFVCTHEFQVGGITVAPSTGQLRTLPGNPDGTGPKGYRSAYSHDQEYATAGYYQVMLQDYNINAEVTATDRVAYLRFTFPESKSSHLIFDIGHQQGESGKVKDSEVWINEDGSVEGWVVTLPEYIKKYQPGADQRIYFSAIVDKKPTKGGVFNGNKVSENQTYAHGIGAGAYLDFNTSKDEQITVKVGISYTSVQNARINLKAEATGVSFDEAKAASQKAWEEALGRIIVEGNNQDDLKKFYSGLYHALLGRGVMSDVNGAYPKHNGTIGQVPMEGGKPKYRMYNTDAMWGGQWNLTQLWALAYPEHLSEFVSSTLQEYKDCGWLADGLANSKYVSGVGTNQLPLMIDAAYQCGIRDFDLELAYEACLKNEMDGKNRPQGAGKDDTADFVELGYAPHKELGERGEDFYFSGSHTLEYAFSAYATAMLGKSLGKTQDYDKLMWMARGWERIFDEKTGYMHPRLRNGEFIANFDPMQVWRGFQEGNAVQYTFYVPHMPEELIKKVGEDEFNKRLNDIFTASQPQIFSGGKEIDAFAGLRTYYNQGNQPCLHISWLFNHSGRPDLSQKWVRAICDEFYGTDGIHGYGYGQDEDQGQLGSWYVLAGIGLFAVDGLTSPEPEFSIGSPIFDKVTIKLNPDYFKGKEFVITAKNNSKKNIYVKPSKLINGKKSKAGSIKFSDVTNGGTLNLTMSKKP